MPPPGLGPGHTVHVRRQRLAQREQGERQTTDVDTYFAAARTWDYFLKQHGRRGINDDGTTGQRS